MKTTTRIATLVLALTASLVLAGAQGGENTDALIQSMVEHHLTQKGLLVDRNLRVSVADKVITLRGEVPTLSAKKRAEQEAKKVEEEYVVVNLLTVKFISVDDTKLAQTVQNQINRYIFYTVFDWVTTEAHNGVVTLKGRVRLPWTAQQIQNQAEKVENVQKVDNQIQSVMGSDEIRYQAARIIYTDPTFEVYAFNQNPPIHIIMDGPNVILEGTVRHEFDKSWAERLVEFHTEAFHVINHLNVAG